jgi:uncharacterized protein
MTQGRGWHLGTHAGQELLLPPNAMLRHAVVFGASGSGKTVACKVLCEEALKSGVPVIAVDPQGDIASMQMSPPDGADVVVWTPGNDAARPLRLNPFGQTPPDDASERTQWIGRQAVNIAALLGIADEEEKTAVIEAALTHAIKRGVKLHSLEDLAEQLENPEEDLAERLNQIARPRVPPDIARTLRRHSFGARGQILECGEPLDIDVLLGRKDGIPGQTRMSIIYLNVLIDQESKASFLGFLLEEVYAWMLRHPSPTGDLQALLFIDELAPFVPPSNRKKPPCKEAFLLLIRQARKYGLGLLLASQNIGDVDYQALNQCNTWLLGSCRALQELNKAREVLSSRVSAPERVAEALPQLPKGEFLILSEEMFRDSNQRRIQVRHYSRAHRPLDVDGLKELRSGTARSTTPHSGATPSSANEPPPPTAGPQTSPPVARVVSQPVDAPVTPVQPLAAPVIPVPPLVATATALPPRPAPASPVQLPPAPVASPRPVTSAVAPVFASSSQPSNAVHGVQSVAPPSMSRGPLTPPPAVHNVNSGSPLTPIQPAASSRAEGFMDVVVSFRNPTIPVSPLGTQVDAVLELTPRVGSDLPPTTLILLVDRSGSMAEGSKLVTACDAARKAAALMREEDRLGLVTFNDQAHVELRAGHVDEHALESALKNVSADGGTQISRALESAVELLADSPPRSAVFLLTDGQTQQDESRCFELADQLRGSHTPVIGFGVGAGWNEPFLRRLTAERYDFLERAEDAPRYFEAAARHFGGMFIRQLRLTFEPIGKAKLLPVVLERNTGGLESERTCEDLGPGPVVHINDVSAHGGALRLVCAFEVMAPASGKLVVSRVRIEGETVAGERIDSTHTLVVSVSSERATYERVEPVVVETLRRVHTKRVLLGAHEDIQSGSPERVARGTRRLRGATRKLDDMGQHDLAKITRRVVEQLDQNAAATDSPELKALRHHTKRI